RIRCGVFASSACSKIGDAPIASASLPGAQSSQETFEKRNKKPWLRQAENVTSRPTSHQPSLTLPSATLSQGRGNAQRRMGGAGLRLPSPAGRRARAAGDGGGAGPRPVPPLTLPSATLSRRERDKIPSPAGRRCRAAADEGSQGLGQSHPS